MKFPAEFVCATHERMGFDRHVPAPIFRKSFRLDAVPEEVSLLIGCPGFYDLWVNGQKITRGFLAPYIANPDDLVYFDAYEISDYLQPGENVIGVMLGAGFQDMIDTIWDFDQARHNGSVRFSLAYESEGLSFTAKDFVWSESEITFNSYRCGTHCDARLEQKGWTEAGFDESLWHKPLRAESPRGEFRLCEADPIRVVREIPPVAVGQGDLVTGPPRGDIPERLGDIRVIGVPIEASGGYLYDFGVNSAGIARLRIRGGEGQRVVLQFAERLKDGKADPTNISFFFPEGYGQRDVYICRGEDEEVYEAPFTYHGFRYVYVSGVTGEQADESLLTFLEMHSDLKIRAELETSDETVNRLWEITRRSDLSNFHYFPTDCPHREKNGWTGDASMSAEHMIFTLGAEQSFTEWMRSIVKAQNSSGALPGIVPTGGWGFAWGNGPAWDSVLFNLPWSVYVYRGETQIIRESAQAMLRYLEYISQQRDEQGIIAIGLGDWCPVGRGADEYLSPLGLTDSIMVMDMCRKAGMMFEAVGLELSSRFAQTLYEELRRDIRAKYLNTSTMLLAGNCQTSQALGLYYGIYEPAERQAAFSALMEIIRRDGDSMNVGFLGGRVLFHVLSDFGKSELAFRMITKKDYPSYGNLLERGATSLWEMFLPEGRLSGSENHHFWGDISHWFLRQLCGINVNPKIKDPNHIVIHPHFADGLDWIRGSYDAPAGTVEVEWTRAEDGIELSVTSADDVRIELTLDSGYCFADSGLSYRDQGGNKLTIISRRTTD